MNQGVKRLRRTRGAAITDGHDNEQRSPDEQLNSEQDEQGGAAQSTVSDDFALVDAYGCLPPVVRFVEDGEREPFECERCGEVYLALIEEVILFEIFGDKAIKPHDCEADGEGRVMQHPSIWVEGPIRWDLMAHRDQDVTWRCLACGYILDASLREILNGEVHRNCWRWWATYWLHRRVAREDGLRTRHRREGCGYGVSGRRRHGTVVRRRSRG